MHCFCYSIWISSDITNIHLAQPSFLLNKTLGKCHLRNIENISEYLLRGMSEI